MCRRKASSSSTWDLMSAQEQVEEAQLRTLGSVCESAFRWVERDHRLRLVIWRRCLAVGDHVPLTLGDRGDGRWCSHLIGAHMACDSGTCCQCLLASRAWCYRRDLRVPATSVGRERSWVPLEPIFPH
jgi:hypothetical protein